MSWFGKKEEKRVPVKPNMSLPDLPKLPELPVIGNEQEFSKQLHQLPSFPSNPLGEKFSQSTIKEAITGGKEDSGGSNANELAEIEDEMQEMQGPHTPLTEEIPGGFRDAARLVRKNEPVFIRIDKFEESLHIFEKTKEQIDEIEKMLSHIKKIKEDEEHELESWEKEIQSIKRQIQRVDSDIFSKVR